MKFGLKENMIQQINFVFQKFPGVNEVIIYGSRAKGNQREGSDIDFTLKGKNLNHDLLNTISLELDKLFLPYIFDISIFEKINDQDLIQHIKRAGKVFYENESESVKI